VRPTREGARFLLATLLIGVAAFNTGNNLIYIIFGMMLSIILISYVMLRTTLHGLLLRVEAGHPVFAGEESTFRITVVNSKHRLSSYSLKIHLPRGLTTEARWAYLACVRPGSSGTASVDAVFRRRGVYSYGDFTIETSFPFIFFTRRLSVPVEGEIVVYPRLRDVDVEGVRRGAFGEFHLSRPGRSDDLLMVREFRSGDDLKRIHWKASARTSMLMIKEFSEQEPRAVTFVLDNSGAPDEFAFERAVSYTASAAWKLGVEGFQVRLVMCGSETAFGAGIEHIFRVLDALATVTETGSIECPFLSDSDGVRVLVLKSERSPLAALAGGEHTVRIHASAL
jgi:uncharacterized protein (DUF58 family)